MYKIYTVKEGEDILSITNDLGITPDEIRRINGFPTNYEVEVGEQIIIPSVSTSPFDRYIVKQGETLYGIASQYDISADDLAKLNGLDKEEYIYPNQELLVPKSGVDFYITSEGDTIAKLRQQLSTDFDTLLESNPYIYLMPDQVLVYEKNSREIN
ncbi:MAG: LysM peptidoglycan-binding domain-containing protein [Bacilli bacterium]|nr:LysM peptidoglycan-binding domain-containing protein [Bacilli bacterium]